MSTTQPFRVLVLCTGNSARSQIAEALLSARGAGRIEASSAGSAPAPRVNPFAVEVLAAHGIAWEGRTPKRIDEVEGVRYDLVMTVCDNAAEACPFFPGAVTQVHWGMPNPAEHEEPEAARAAFKETYQALGTRVDAFLALPLEQLSPSDLKQHATAIHTRLSVR